MLLQSVTLKPFKYYHGATEKWISILTTNYCTLHLLIFSRDQIYFSTMIWRWWLDMLSLSENSEKIIHRWHFFHFAFSVCTVVPWESHKILSHGWGWYDPYGPASAPAGTPRAGYPGSCLGGFWTSPRRKPHSFSGQPVPVLYQLHSTAVLPDVEREPPLFQSVSTVHSSGTGPKSILFTLSLKVFIDTDVIISEPPLL